MAKVEKVTKDELYEDHRVDRGWGFEIWVENLPEYCGKLLDLEKGKRCSMHFHMKKLETMFLVEGQVDIKFIDPDTGKPYVVSLEKGDAVRIPRGQVHQIIANKPSSLIEFSTTHEEEDSYRVEKGD